MCGEAPNNDGHPPRSTAASTGGKPMTDYAETYRRSLERPEEFWAEAAEAIDWERRWNRVLNTCRNAIDRHVAAGRGDRIALIWDSPVTGQVKRFTYRKLQSVVARLAGVLTSLG